MAVGHIAEEVEVRGSDPFVARRRLSRRLRRLREGAGQTQQQLADALEWSLSKVIRIETEVVTVSLADLRLLLSHFEVTDPEIVEAALAQSRASRTKPWHDAYKDILNPEYRRLLGFEASAAVIKEYCPSVVSGLYQDRPYAMALAEVAGEERTGFDANSGSTRWVDARIRRQELLDQADAPTVHLILGEAVLRQIVADPQTTAAQLQHLRDLAERPRFTVQVLPFDAGQHNGLWGPYTIYELHDSDAQENILFFESAASDLLVRDDPALGSQFERRHDRLAELARPAEDTVSILGDAIRRLS
ncbi:hypothetical protein ALI144C_52850 [Actinosynnema sp. ALI-1.44]|uniref:helix-turn-helix domain-containing protein n=1 Tax=Actinosynnema sp. ALI-1.44 TaxID=1933779 RepID=UPI00097C4C3C|nr:helix-turn-helix transcriptional regulator [Actinosynnema sp. ALI-1.44]ONI71209.1 hypothetical protein ALI144C_52850 [Actinosynnema sp. ALI-1.44]